MDREELLKQIGKRVRQLREERNLSQWDLASAIGKDQQSVQRLEKGGINPSLFYLYQIAEGLSLDLKDLLDFSKI